MWTLIVVTTFFNHAVYDPSIYQFHDVQTEARCVQLKEWIDKREEKKVGFNHAMYKVETQCVKAS